MSLYQSPQPYAHMGYTNPPTYPQQPLPPPNYYPPPPQPVYHADPTYFRRDYAARLAQLTVNSRPIIQSLSMMAQEYSRFADIVVQCIEQHIRRVPPWMKLPAFYLLDAISKNVYEPYARHFVPVVVRLFLDTYEVVDPSTRSKMEEMLLTWRTGSPNRTQLFGVMPQTAIERQIWPESTQESSGKPGQPSISTAQVLSEFEFVLSAKQRTLQATPYDKQTQNHVNVLYQLRNLVQAGVSQEELGQILTQLRTMAPAPPPAPVAPIPPVAPVSQAYPPASYPAPGAQPSYPAAQPSYSQAAYSSAGGSSNAPAPAAPVASTSAGPTTSAPAIPVNVSSLFSALVKAGVVSASASSTPTGAGATAGDQVSTAASASVAAQDYRHAILSVGIRLTATDIAKRRPPVARFLYDDLPGQCKQCGIRFRGDADGKKRLEDHLDMHFTQNRKASQAAGRGYSRGWFVPIDDWLQDGAAVDVKGKGRADRISMKAVTAQETAKRDADLRSMFVVVPAGDEAKPVACPICKEILKSEFLEDDEEWVWRNAVKKDDRIFHATCHAEATSTKSNLATRLRTELSGRSRSRTPEVSRTPPRDGDVKIKTPSPPASPNRGTKRKADAQEPTAKTEDDSTPPLKKLALSSP